MLHKYNYDYISKCYVEFFNDILSVFRKRIEMIPSFNAKYQSKIKRLIINELDRHIDFVIIDIYNSKTEDVIYIETEKLPANIIDIINEDVTLISEVKKYIEDHFYLKISRDVKFIDFDIPF
ncbi:hypothetical protein DXZ79_19990 [Yersinia rochesterensis]|uniref:Uncharacterized protein n=2 Tax=Yersinia rochesterensis TaxID=1604335 RepID=A0A8E4BMD3_9GAMM|nr:hypothetical protein DXZ79_19990 [Yersinia rochesterensis]